MDSLLLSIACCVFCFITGMYAAHMIEQGRGCQIEVTRGQVTTVTMGRRQ
jgi:hypothetical protein